MRVCLNVGSTITAAELLSFIAESDIQFGIARMFKTFHDMHYPEGYAFIARNEEEADKLIKITIS